MVITENVKTWLMGIDARVTQVLQGHIVKLPLVGSLSAILSYFRTKHEDLKMSGKVNITNFKLGMIFHCSSPRCFPVSK